MNYVFLICSLVCSLRVFCIEEPTGPRTGVAARSSPRVLLVLFVLLVLLVILESRERAARRLADRRTGRLINLALTKPRHIIIE